MQRWKTVPCIAVKSRGGWMLWCQKARDRRVLWQTCIWLAGSCFRKPLAFSFGPQALTGIFTTNLLKMKSGNENCEGWVKMSWKAVHENGNQEWLPRWQICQSARAFKGSEGHMQESTKELLRALRNTWDMIESGWKIIRLRHLIFKDSSCWVFQPMGRSGFNYLLRCTLNEFGWVGGSLVRIKRGLWMVLCHSVR